MRGPRLLLIALGLGLAPFPTLGAQDRVSVSLTLTANATPGGAPTPTIATRNLVTDPHWASVLNEPIPVRIRYRLELWRSRALNDALERPFEWEALVRLEPLYEQFSLTIINRGRVTDERRRPTLLEIGSFLDRGMQVLLRPRQPGVYYYTLNVTVTALSDRELEDYERLIQGDPGAAGGARSTVPGLGRSARRWLLRVSGLPPTELRERTETFTVTEVGNSRR